jgi:hypothetical protein
VGVSKSIGCQPLRHQQARMSRTNQTTATTTEVLRTQRSRQQTSRAVNTGQQASRPAGQQAGRAHRVSTTHFMSPMGFSSE